MKKAQKQSRDYVDAMDAALRRSGMTQTKFGYLHFGDPGFFTRLRKGHALHGKTVERIENVLAEYEIGK